MFLNCSINKDAIFVKITWRNSFMLKNNQILLIFQLGSHIISTSLTSLELHFLENEPFTFPDSLKYLEKKTLIFSPNILFYFFAYGGSITFEIQAQPSMCKFIIVYDPWLSYMHYRIWHQIFWVISLLRKMLTRYVILITLINETQITK